jgi:hypothetical protein
MFKQMKVWLALTTIFSLLALMASCGGDKAVTNDAGPTNDSATAKTFAPKGNEGSVTGVVAYNGTPGAPKKIDTSADPVCGTANPNLMTEAAVVKDGKLANVFVYIKDGTTADGTKVGDYTYPTSTATVTLDQKGCQYVPHVLGLQVNQPLTITNSDATQHNIHPTPKVNLEWNKTQANGAAPLTEKFTRAEVLIPVKCNQHPWMKSYVGVLKHPFFAVSAADGSFTIKGVPPGTYTVAAWHEGGAAGTEKTMQVTVPASGSGKADFAFGDAATASTSSGLTMMPALEISMIGRH